MTHTSSYILLFEPDPILRRRFSLLLCSAGFRRIREAASAEEAEQLLRCESFSAIVCDGEHFVRETLRLMERESVLSDRCHIPFLYYSGDERTDPLKEFRSLIGSERIALPFTASDLCRRLDMVLHLASFRRRTDSPYRHLSDMPECTEERNCLLGSTAALRQRIEEAFCDLGLMAHFGGYHYLQTAILLVFRNPDRYSHITKELYPAVARIYQTTSSRVERSIRTVIAAAWKPPLRESIARYFPPSECILYEHPTNSRFIAAVVSYLHHTPPGETH